jgi:hypothetical protein
MYMSEVLIRDQHAMRLKQARESRMARQAAQLRRLRRVRQRAESQLERVRQRAGELSAHLGAEG